MNRSGSNSRSEASSEENQLKKTDDMGTKSEGRFSNLAQRVQQAIDEMSEERMSLNAELTQSRQQVDRLNSDIKARDKTIRAQQSEHTKLQNESTDLKTQLERLLAEKSSLVEEKHRLTATVADLKNFQDEQTEKIRKLEEEKNEDGQMWAAKCEDLAANASKLEKSKKKLELENEGRKAVNGRVTAENESIRSQFGRKLKEMEKALAAAQREKNLAKMEHEIQKKNLTDQLQATKATAAEVQMKLSEITGLIFKPKPIKKSSSVTSTLSTVGSSRATSSSCNSNATSSTKSNITSSSGASSSPQLPSILQARRGKRTFYQAGPIDTKKAKK